MKQAIKVLILWHFFFLFLYGEVLVTAPKSFIKGEPYLFSITALGEDVAFPKIDAISGFMVEKAGTSRSVSNINGNITVKLIQQYRLFPTKDFLLPSFTLKIDGKEFNTKPINISKEQVKKTDSIYFEFNLKASKKELYVGEDVLITLQFKYRKDIQLLNLGLNEPNLEHFWQQKLEANKKYQEGDFMVQELSFLLFPQKSGQLTIEPMSIEASVLDLNSNAFSFFNNRSKNLRVYSNELTFDVKPLPKGVHLVGDFKIDSNVDKTEVEQGKNVNLTIKIQGEGNLEDIQPLNLEFDNATVYDNKPEITTKIEDGVLKGEYTKSFTILPNGNITIPSFTIQYFEKETHSIKTLQTNAYEIKVENKKEVQPLTTLQKAPEIHTQRVVQKVVVKNSLEDRAIFFVLGVLITLLSIGLYFYVINRKQDKIELPLEKLIKKSKTNEELIKILLPYIHLHDDIKVSVFELEKHNDNELKVIKKRLLSIINENKIKGL